MTARRCGSGAPAPTSSGERAPLVISSGKNPRLQRLIALEQHSSLRREEGVFVVEGQREVERCQAAGYQLLALYLCPAIYGGEHPLFATPRDVQLYHLTPEAYNRIAYRGGTEGLVAEVAVRPLRLDDLRLSPAPLVVVLEAVEKPGNLGAILRSADAAGADAVVVCDPLTDLYNPNLLRSSLGARFSVPCVACQSEECIQWLRRRGIQILTAQLQDSHLYYDTPMTMGTAIVMGTESTGLTAQWRQAADRHIRIPMLGAMDSLNVSVSAAILLYEAVRQRSFA